MGRLFYVDFGEHIQMKPAWMSINTWEEIKWMKRKDRQIMIMKIWDEKQIGLVKEGIQETL